MKITIDVPDEEMKRLMENTKAKTKREAVVHAIKDFNRRKRLAQLAKVLGTFEDFMTQNELKEMREDETWKIPKPIPVPDDLAQRLLRKDRDIEE